MPIYEYRCQSCDKILEVLVRGGKEPTLCGDRCLNLDHPEAKSGELVKKVSKAGVIFKGSGFYVTDSRSGSGTNGKSPEKKTSEEKSGSESSKASGEASSKDSSTKSSSNKSESSGSKTAE